MRRARRRLGEWFTARATAFQGELERALADCRSVLDVGCGSQSPLRLLANRPPRLVGVDGFEPAIEQSRAAGIHDEYRCLRLGEIGRSFASRSFDAVVLIDVVEHFEKAEGEALLDASEAIASKRVVVFTPNGFLPQGEHYGNPYQRHRSGRTAPELRARGYSVLGINGWRPLRGDLAAVRFRPRRLWEAISLLTVDYCRDRPELAFQLLGVLDRASGASDRPTMASFNSA